MVDSRLAVALPNGVLQMRESDHRYDCETAAQQAPKFNVVELPYQECWLNQEAAVLRFASKAA